MTLPGSERRCSLRTFCLSHLGTDYDKIILRSGASHLPAPMNLSRPMAVELKANKQKEKTGSLIGVRIGENGCKLDTHTHTDMIAVQS